MKKLFHFLFAAIPFVANAQLNLKWSNTQSLSGGIYKSTPVGLGDDSTHHWIYTLSNEYFEATGDSIRGFITKYDYSGNLQWNLTLSPAVSISSPDTGSHGIASNLGSETWHDIVAYNTSSTTSHLIKINSNGTIAWDILVNGVNSISHTGDGTAGYIYVIGRTTQSDCGGFPCNGIAIAKYDTAGQHLWTRTRYTSNLRTRPSDMVIDNAGNIIVCGKIASNLSSSNYNQTFVLKYAPNGSFLWQKEFNETTTETLSDNGCIHWLSVDLSNNIYFATDVVGTNNNNHTTKLRKISGASGVVQWTKTINNSELNGIQFDNGTGEEIISTSTGMKAYNSTGTLLWSNGFQVIQMNISTDAGSILEIISKNVNALEPLKNYFVQLNTSTGAVIYKKDLSVNEVYQGDYDGLQGIDYDNEFMLLINDTTAPYGTRLTKLSPCSDFTYSFSASTTATDVSNAACNNGEINVNWSGTFNSWPHLEIYDDQLNFIAQLDNNYIFQNLTARNYTVKVFDESCGEQDFNVTVKCPAPTGFSTTNITRNKARLNWTLPTCNAGVQLQYRLQGAPSWTTVNTSASYKQLNGLIPNSLYEWQVATKCGTVTPAVYSDFSAVQLFSTPAQRLAGEEISTDQLPATMNIYPNPASNILTVESEIEIATLLKIKVVDVTGRELISFTEQAQEGMWQKEIDVTALPKGIYLLQIISERGVITKRFVSE